VVSNGNRPAIGMLFQLDNGSANLTRVARDAEVLASRWERV
jgi:hypothetical protein